MPRVFGRGSRSRPAALVSDRDDAALFPAPVSGAARRWRAPESRAGRAPTLLRCLAPAPRSAARWPQRTWSAYQASSISLIRQYRGAGRLPALTRRALPDFAEPYLSRIRIAGNNAASSRSLTSAAGCLRLPLLKTRGIERAPRDHSPTGDRREKTSL